MIRYTENKIFYGIFITLIGVHGILIGFMRLYPCIDLPLHLASATINRYIGETSNSFQNFFSLQPILGQPNSIHLLFCGLKVLPTVEFANKLFYCSYIILLPLSILHLIKTVGGNKWFSLLSFLYLYNHSVMWGFVDYMLSIPLVIFFITVLYKFIFKERPIDLIIISFLLIILFFAHTLTTLLCLSTLFIAIISFYRHSILKGLIKSLVSIPTIILAVRWWHLKGSSTGEGSTLNSILNFYRYEYLNTFTWRKGFLYWDHNFLYGGYWGYILGIMLSLFVFTIVIYTIWLNKNTIRSTMQSNQFKFISVFLLVSVLFILFLPMIRNYFVHSYNRFSVFFFLSLIVLASVFAKNKLKPLNCVIITIVVILHFGLWADYFIQFQRENKEFKKEFFADCQNDHILSGLIYNYQYRGKPIYIHFPNYHIIWNKAIATSVIGFLRFGWKIDRIKNINDYPRYDEWIGMRDNYDGRYKNLDYILIRGNVTESGKKYLYNFKLWKSSGLYQLYKNNQTED